MYKDGEGCPVCDSGKLYEQIIEEVFGYKNKKIKIPDYHIFRCDDCQEELVHPKSIKATEKTLTDFRRRVDGLLTSNEIKDIRKKLGMTQKELAIKLKVGLKTFARYENGQVTQNASMDFLLRVIDKHPFILEETYNKKEPEYEVLDRVSMSCCDEKSFQPTYEIKEQGYKGFAMGAEIAA